MILAEQTYILVRNKSGSLTIRAYFGYLSDNNSVIKGFTFKKYERHNRIEQT